MIEDMQQQTDLLLQNLNSTDTAAGLVCFLPSTSTEETRHYKTKLSLMDINTENILYESQRDSFE